MHTTIRISLFIALLVLSLGAQGRSVQDALRQYGPAARGRLAPHFSRAHVAYPPRKLTLIGLKDQGKLLIYAPDRAGEMRFVREYPVLAQGAQLGPKLREGDGQTPEGIYGINVLNPNSSYHLSLGVSYPNKFDRDMGRRELRYRLGGAIMIHGSMVSVGCLAMGDEAIEEIFVLAADTGIGNIKVILSPVDFRNTDYRDPDTAWVNDLYAKIRTEMKAYPLPPGSPKTRATPPPPDRVKMREEIQKNRLLLAALAVLALLLLVSVTRRIMRGPKKQVLP